MAMALRMLSRGGRLAVCFRGSSGVGWLRKEVVGSHRSDIQWRRRSNAASAPSESLNPQKRGKKVSKDHRRAMLAAYVERYREANAGKFPSASKAKKEVGGNFYIIRQMIQELEYGSKMDHLTTGLKTPTSMESRKNRKSVTEIRHSLSHETNDDVDEIVVEAISSGDADIGANLMDETAAEDHINPDVVGQQSTPERKIDREIPCPPERLGDVSHEVSDDVPKLVSDQTHVEGESGVDKSPRESSDDTEEVDSASSKELVGLTGLDSLQGQEMQFRASDPSTENQEVVEPPQKSSLWGNLKTFADGIISIWRNR